MQVGYAAGVVHENIVQLLDVFAEGDQYVIVVRLQVMQYKHVATPEYYISFPVLLMHLDTFWSASWPQPLTDLSLEF